ncbi:MAG: hypothetical protein NW224_30265 [Leptolyngbyaceae cyanobacterium bins.302]|nr:hypothetical protein [Leptolyngbyaceae cyanobacterium bins.302]
MLFRLLLLLALAGALTGFTLQNLTPLLPLVFLGITFPALPLSWWVLGAIAAGAISMLAIQILFGLSNFVTGQTVRSRVRSNTNRATQSRWTSAASADSTSQGTGDSPRRDRSASSDDSAWQDWRGYESSQSRTASRSTSNPVDDWERPPSEDWEGTTRQNAPRDRGSDRVQPEDLKNFEANSAPKRGTQSGSSYSYSYREPQDTGVGKTESVVDADYRVIVPPFKPLDEPTIPIPPPPPPAEENADDWFEDSSSDDFGDTKRDRS